jgi:hypothetical protein
MPLFLLRSAASSIVSFFFVFVKVCFTQLTCMGHVPITVQAKTIMVKGNLLTPVDRISAPTDVIWRFIHQGLSVRAIALQLQQLGFTDSKSTVQRRVTTMQQQSCIVSNLLKKKTKLLDQRTQRRIRDWIRTEHCHGKMRVFKRLRELGHTVSYRTVCRTLKSMQYIKFGYPSQKVFMTARHRQLRLAWARQQLESPLPWNEVFFADEKQYLLDGPQRRQKVLYDKRDPKPYVARKGDGNRSLHIWGVFSLDVVPPLRPISAHYNAAEYTSVLATGFIPYTRTHQPILLHDRHSVHRARQTTTWLDALGIQVILIPAKSPDLNPIENLWSIVNRQVFPGIVTYTNKDSLLSAINAAWETVRTDRTLRRHLVDSMTERFQAVVRAKGGPTKF